MKNKKGWISFEYVIASSIIIIASIAIFFKWWPENFQKVTSVSKDYVMSHMPSENTNKPNNSGSGGIIESDDPAELTDFEYSENGDYVVITGYNGSATDITIPDTINDKEVAEIADNSFNGKNLTSVIIPDTVKKIGDYAFENNNIKTLKLPKSMNSIGAGAFRNNDITSVSVPKGITTLKQECFANNKISRLNLNGEITTIESGVFINNQISSLDIPDSVTSIGNNAFRNNYISLLIIGSKCTTIGEDAFKEQGANKINVTVKAQDGLSTDRFSNDWDTKYWSCSSINNDIGENCSFLINK